MNLNASARKKSRRITSIMDLFRNDWLRNILIDSSIRKGQQLLIDTHLMGLITVTYKTSIAAGHLNTLSNNKLAFRECVQCTQFVALIEAFRQRFVKRCYNIFTSSCLLACVSLVDSHGVACQLRVWTIGKT